LSFDNKLTIIAPRNFKSTPPSLAGRELESFDRFGRDQFECLFVKNDHRPVNVNPSDLMAFAWPVSAIASITHRIAGVVLFAGIAFGLYALDMSLSSAAGFETFKGMLKSLVGMFITWGLLSALAYHFVAGIKHLLLDMEIGDTIEGSKFAARTTFLVAAILIILAAVWVVQA
jgi:succinate dehydrogenase / fumarate reductase, cytochrome b subunit